MWQGNRSSKKPITADPKQLGIFKLLQSADFCMCHRISSPLQRNKCLNCLADILRILSKYVHNDVVLCHFVTLFALISVFSIYRGTSHRVVAFSFSYRGFPITGEYQGGTVSASPRTLIYKQLEVQDLQRRIMSDQIFC